MDEDKSVQTSTDEKPEIITYNIKPHDVFITLKWDFQPYGAEDKEEK